MVRPHLATPSSVGCVFVQKRRPDLPSRSSTRDVMEDVATLLHRFGMSEYTDRFLAEGFDTWDVVRDITEADLAFLGVGVAHRKRL